MNRPELYHKTVDILYQAYFGHTLEHGSCYACAVGNMIAANLGIEMVKAESYVRASGIRSVWATASAIENMWYRAFSTDRGIQSVDLDYYELPEIKKQIDSTGYEITELMKIEFAFETAFKGKSEEDYMFNGLVAVLEVLKTIHEVTDEDLLQKNTERFKNHYATLTA